MEEESAEERLKGIVATHTHAVPAMAMHYLWVMYEGSSFRIGRLVTSSHIFQALNYSLCINGTFA